MGDKSGTGRLFAFEGVDGSGKSTQIRICAQSLLAAGREVVQVREPGGTPLSDAIRTLVLDPRHTVDARAELLLYMAARAQLVAEVIAPALQAGKIVLADRFGWSTLAYQGYGRGLDLNDIAALMGVACGPVWPDFIAVLDIEPGARKQRLLQQGRPLDRIESQGEEFFTRVRRGFLTLAAEGKTPSRVFSAEEPESVLAEQIQASLAAYLPPIIPSSSSV